MDGEQSENLKKFFENIGVVRLEAIAEQEFVPLGNGSSAKSLSLWLSMVKSLTPTNGAEDDVLEMMIMGKNKNTSEEFIELLGWERSEDVESGLRRYLEFISSIVSAIKTKWDALADNPEFGKYIVRIICFRCPLYLMLSRNSRLRDALEDFPEVRIFENIHSRLAEHYVANTKPTFEEIARACYRIFGFGFGAHFTTKHLKQVKILLDNEIPTVNPLLYSGGVALESSIVEDSIAWVNSKF